ncbi:MULTISPECIES: LysR family transcriptional regulator [unclassified Ruegeria]|uniref:LysR family transcriptional regulator n=1 Tax=unclassified Ruegeria TaxID=2625375 RepID=UPI00149183E2|nr:MULTISPECIES: LysR family transcriptional regulator [unclassified Ruegeria]NOC46355.1 LysR family transcriptional regulator [Ruegeria sp. HKCCD7559]NOD86706.1 LysR family transcriptional regulator [Ruegeria sp. HKCCD6119]
MDIELARTFLAVVETGTFLDAANKVHVTQSTVSMRIRTLEQQLGQPVFQRGKSGATLTIAGRHFLKHAQVLVRTWTQAKLDAGLPASMAAALEIGAAPSLWDGYLINALPELMAALPNVAVRASAASSEAMAREIEEGSLDLAVMYRPRNASGLSALQLFEDEFVLVSSGPDAEPAALGSSYILIDWGPEFRADHLLNFPELDAPRLQLGIGTLGLQYLKSVPAAGYFPRRVIETELQDGWLTLIEAAPRFAYAAYAVFDESEVDGFPGQAARRLRSFADSMG